MPRLEAETTAKGKIRTDVRLRDFSQLANAHRLAMSDASVFQAVQEGRSRIYSFKFKTRAEFESFADCYAEASLPASGSGSEDDDDDDDDSSRSGETSGSNEGDSSAAILDGESQDLMQLYYNSAAAATARAMRGLTVQPSIGEEAEDSDSDSTGEE